MMNLLAICPRFNDCPLCTPGDPCSHAGPHRFDDTLCNLPCLRQVDYQAGKLLPRHVLPRSRCLTGFRAAVLIAIEEVEVKET